MKTYYLTGKKIYFRSYEPEDVKDNVFNWVNDPEVTYFMLTGQKPMTVEALLKEYETLISDPRNVIFAVADKKTGKMIGTIGLYNVRPVTCAAELRIIIGEKKVWGKGYGTEACLMLLDYAFNRLNLHKVFLGVNSDNKSAVKCYKKAGFIEEGILRDEIYRNGKFYDALRMSILRAEYEKLNGGK
ncbi:MAG: GNAT family protein [bacterium]|nr:GNAT family protein [bacterium]